MSVSPYPGFTPLNNRRLELVLKKHQEGGTGLSPDEEREMDMLGVCVGAMCHYRWPYKPLPFALPANLETFMDAEEVAAYAYSIPEAFRDRD